MLLLHKAGATQDTAYRILNKLWPALLQSRSYTGHNLQNCTQDVTCHFTKQKWHSTQFMELDTQCDPSWSPQCTQTPGNVKTAKFLCFVMRGRACCEGPSGLFPWWEATSLLTLLSGFKVVLHANLVDLHWVTTLFMPCGRSLMIHFTVMVSKWVQHSFYLSLCFSSSVKTSLCF